MEVTLWQMLSAREGRAEAQRLLLGRYGQTLVSFTMNIPGPVKDSPLIRRAFYLGCSRLEALVPQAVRQELVEAVTGCEARYTVPMEPRAVKRICTAIEEETPIGRLFDLDVLASDGTKLEREQVGGGSRDCIVCGAPGRGCASRRTHTVAQLQGAAGRLMAEHFANADRAAFAAQAVESLLEEVAITPKPGLVDRRNSGSHRDMDIHTFTASAKALGPYFRDCVELGQQREPLPETFEALRVRGRQAEQEMYRATGGINTHKGAIFTLGLLCGSLGWLWRPEEPLGEMGQLLKTAGEMARISLADLPAAQGATAGERLYQARGLTGIRGEVAAGLPSVLSWGLPAFREALGAGSDRNEAGLRALLQLIAHVEDTNLYHRGGPQGAAWAKAAVAGLPEHPTRQQLEALDDVFIARNLSPGGCADLLAVTCFLNRLYDEIK